MAEVRILPLGVGDAFTARHYTTCLALGVGDDWLLLDCPHPVRKMLREASEAAGLALDLDAVRGVALSHLHADHCSGLEDFAFYSHYVLNRRAQVLAHPEVGAKLWPGTLHGGMGEVRARPGAPHVARTFHDFFALTPLDETRPVAFGPFSVECRQTIHSVPTTAFRVRAGGRTLAFSADTAFDPGLIEWLAEADLVVHEVTTHPQAASVHTLYDDLAALPSPLRARMRLIHYPDAFDPFAAGCAIEALHQGRLYPV